MFPSSILRWLFSEDKFFSLAESFNHRPNTSDSPLGATAPTTDFSPFRRGYTRGGVATNGALVRLHQGSPGSAPRTSFQQLQESPINNIRRSCPQSPRTLTQTNGHGMFCFFSPQISPTNPIRIAFNFNLINNFTVFATPPAPRRKYFPSPKPSRPSWVQRHLQKRPQTVNVDDATLSGKQIFTLPSWAMSSHVNILL